MVIGGQNQRAFDKLSHDFVISSLLARWYQPVNHALLGKKILHDILLDIRPPRAQGIMTFFLEAAS